jgi:hypothetical protein
MDKNNNNNTKTVIKKHKKMTQDGGYKSSRFIRPLHPGLTLNSSYPRYLEDSLYPYYPPSSILARSTSMKAISS